MFEPLAEIENELELNGRRKCQEEEGDLWPSGPFHDKKRERKHRHPDAQKVGSSLG